MRIPRTVAVVALLATACSAQAVGRGLSPATTSGSADTFMPAPDLYVPKDPDRLADVLARTTWALRSSIERWTSGGDPATGKPPRAVRLQALYQQRIYRFLARHEDTARATLDALPTWARGEAKANIAAGGKLFSLVHPVKRHVRFRVGLPKPAGVLLGFYREAERRFDVSWAVLAAVNYVESKFGRVRSNSSAGAQGPMQFIPSTWRAYGMGGDVHDPHDAILGAANYLHASGAPGDNRDALYAYNHAWAYVDAVLIYAKRMLSDPRAYYEYYDWQVFIVTVDGDKRLTGPGLP
ncbi:MAG: transglycosylase SLT domain-containing protein [Actinomycetota bacterium]